MLAQWRRRQVAFYKDDAPTEPVPGFGKMLAEGLALTCSRFASC
jgi:hypothetical protein